MNIWYHSFYSKGHVHKYIYICFFLSTIFASNYFWDWFTVMMMVSLLRERSLWLTFFLLLFSVRIINTKYNNNEVIDRRKKKFSGLLFIVCLKHSTLVLVLKTFSHFNWNYMLNAYFFSLSLFFHVLQFSRWSTTVGANVWKQQQQGTPHRREQRIHEKKTVRSQFFSLPITTITLHVLFSGCQEIKNSSLHSWQLFQAKTNLWI